MDPIGTGDLERLAARGWPGLEQQRYGDWLLRAGAGFTGRANSVLVVGSPPGPLPAAVADTTQWYRSRGLVPAAQLPSPGSEEADDAFAAAGWGRDEDTLVLTAALADDGPPAVPVQLHAAPDEAWLRGYRYRGAALPAAAPQVLTNVGTCVFAAVRTAADPAPLAAVARGVLTGGWLGVTAVTVDAEHRRRGLATAVMTALSGWARARGAHSVYLQVASGNGAARALYARSGFTEHHRYHYRRLG